MEGLIHSGSLTAAAVFLEGVLSFFSPCVLPLLPLYMSYLAGDAEAAEQRRRRIALHTVSFIAGISAAFFLLGLAFTGIGFFLRAHQTAFSTAGGVLIVLLGLFQLGVLKADFLFRERRFRFPFAPHKMNHWLAFALGFTFSFAWTPCVGPALSSVLLLVSSAQDTWAGIFLIAVYAAGFVIPFLLLGLFTAPALAALKRHQRFFRSLVKLGGALLIAIGLLMATGYMNRIGGYLGGPESAAAEDTSTDVPAGRQKNAAFDFQLTDQYGKVHTLSEYRGKVVFLNFWATWCPPCRQEMPHIEALYEKQRRNGADVVVLGVANPKTEEYSGQDLSEAEIKAFLTKNGYHFPVLFDRTGAVFRDYAIRALPTTFMIDRDGNVFGYVSGALRAEMMDDIVAQTLAGRRSGNGEE